VSTVAYTVATIFLSQGAFITLQLQIELCRLKCIKLLVHIPCFAVNPKKACIYFAIPNRVMQTEMHQNNGCIPCFAVNPRKPCIDFAIPNRVMQIEMYQTCGWHPLLCSKS
jgi:hypothetical protein